MLSARKKLTAYLLLFFLGYFGAHRFYARKKQSACMLLALSVLQVFIILTTFMDPASVWLVPQYAAYRNIDAFMGLLSSPSLVPNASPQAAEEAYVLPALWVATLPSFIATIWIVIDAFRPAKWLSADDVTR